MGYNFVRQLDTHLDPYEFFQSKWGIRSCHSERSEESVPWDAEILSAAKNDTN